MYISSAPSPTLNPFRRTSTSSISIYIYIHIFTYVSISRVNPQEGILQRSNAQMHLSRAVHQESSCPAHANRARASCLPDSNPYGRDGVAHSRSLSTARRALRVA